MASIFTSASGQYFAVDNEAVIIKSIVSIGVIFLFYRYLWFKKRHKDKPTE